MTGSGDAQFRLSSSLAQKMTKLQVPIQATLNILGILCGNMHQQIKKLVEHTLMPPTLPATMPYAFFPCLLIHALKKAPSTKGECKE